MAKLKKEPKIQLDEQQEVLVGQYNSVDEEYIISLEDDFVVTNIDPKISEQFEIHKDVIMSVATAVDALDSKVKAAMERNNEVLVNQFTDINDSVNSLNSRISNLSLEIKPCFCKCKPETLETQVKEIVIEEKQTVKYEENKQLNKLIKINKMLMVVSVVTIGVLIFI